MPLPRFTFSNNVDCHNSPLVPSDPRDPRYQVRTDYSKLLMRQTTTVTPVDESGTPRYDVPTGVLDWKAHTMSVGHKTIDWKELKTHTEKGVWSGIREWQWGNQPYSIDFSYRRNRWEVQFAEGKAPESYGSPSLAATFTLYHFHLFKKSDKAYVEFAENVSLEEQIFLLLVLLQSEAKRIDQQTAAAIAAS